MTLSLVHKWWGMTSIARQDTGKSIGSTRTVLMSSENKMRTEEKAKPCHLQYSVGYI